MWAWSKSRQERSEGTWQGHPVLTVSFQDPPTQDSIFQILRVLKILIIVFFLSCQDKRKRKYVGYTFRTQQQRARWQSHSLHLLSKVGAWGTRHQSLIPPFSTPHSHACAQRSDSTSDPFPLTHRLSKRLTNVLILLYLPQGSIYWTSISHIHKFVFYSCEILTP